MSDNGNQVNSKRSLTALLELPVFEAVRQGFIYIIPVIVVGAIVSAVIHIPIPAFQAFATERFGDMWQKVADITNRATLEIISISIVISMSFSLAEKSNRASPVKSVYFVIGALVCFMIFQPPPVIAGEILIESQVGSASIFTAIIIAIVSTKLLIWFYQIYDKLLPAKEHRFNSNYIIRTAFHFLPPLVGVMAIFLCVNLLINGTGLSTAFTSGADAFFAGLFGMGKQISSAILIFLTQISWFFGIHGGDVFLHFVGGAIDDTTGIVPIFTQLPRGFFDTFVFSGGSGATLAMIPALFIFGKSTERKIAKISILPGVFNINEPIVFGLPIVLNPFYFIPFIIVPMLNSIVSLAVVGTGIVPMPNNDVYWSTPIIISGYLATGSPAGAVLQLVNFAISFAVYAPFVKLAAKHSERRYKEEFDNLTKRLSYLQNGAPLQVLGRSDDLGVLARFLSREISDAMKDDSGNLYLQYQPKTDYDGKVVGAEALLRWNHPLFGYVSPMTVLTIADESKLSTNLGRWIITKTFSDMKKWNSPGVDKLKISINLSPMHLESDPELSFFIKAEAAKREIDTNMLDFELTENAVILKTDDVNKTLLGIRSMGADVSIDDFGMGHSSLMYLYDLHANVVKLDASLTQAVTDDAGRRSIVASIVDLCKKLDVKVIAEGTETKEQVDIIHGMGVNYFQGYYFSKPLPTGDFNEYVREHGVSA